MRNRKRMYRASAILLILALLTAGASTGADEKGADAPGTVYSDWLTLDGFPESGESADAPSGTRDLGALLREAALLDAEGVLLADDGVWTVEPDTAYQVRLRFRETPGSGNLQFDAENTPLTYHLPEGLSVGDENLTLTLRVGPDGGETAEAVCECDAASGVLAVNWDPGSGITERIRETEEAGFELIIPAVFGDTDTLDFADHLTVTLDRSDTGRGAPPGKTRGGTGASSDLADFLDSIEIAGAELNAQEQYVILEGVPYTVQLHFSEKINGPQFAEDPETHLMTYHFPNGFTPNYTEGDAEFEGDGGEVRFHYIISGNTLTVAFDEESPGYPAFSTSESAEFEIHTTGIISEEEIAFSAEVSGEFDIDDKREVSVQKTGTYDAGLNRVRYTVTAYSRGNNTDIHIGDIISGTALTYDPSSLTVSSDKRDPVQYNTDTRPGETFGLTLPVMVHGETVTIEYCADVDLSGLTGTVSGSYGTVEETMNTVKVSSHEDPPGDDTTVSGEDFENKISLSGNSKTVSSQTVSDGKTYIIWTIVLNENANISIAGSEVTDIIDESSRPFMRYSGSGIHIERYEKDGTPAGSDDIRWGTNGLSAGYGGSTWSYTIPESDAGKNYRYVITYETEVDSDTFLKPTTVSNTVGNEYDTDHGAVNVDTTGEGVEAEKKVVNSVTDAANKQAETEWEITFTVPAAGLDSAVITDILPGFLDYTTNTWFYDTYKEGSVRVEDGDLLEGENFSVDSTSQENRVIITFTKNNGESGLTGTGLTRTIHVYLKTTASHDWLVYAETQSRARTHVNNGIVRVNGQDINVTASVNYNTSEYDLEKKFGGTYYTNTDPALPIYVYKIILTNVNDDAFDAEGFLTVADYYDSDYLTFQPTYQTNDGYNVNTPNGHVYGNNQWNPDGTLSQGSYVVASSTPEGEIVFKLKKDDLPMFGNSYYPYYAIVYALQIRDAETLARMKEEALHSDGLMVGLVNTADNEKFGTNTIVTEYSVSALTKRLISEEDNSATGTHDLQFEIMVNEDELKIGDGETITLKDTLTNLSFDYTSIAIEPQLEGDTLNRAGNSIIFTLHNETKYRITYTARLVGIHDVDWHNKAELYGQIAGVNGTSSSESGGSGSYLTYKMNVKKYPDGNMNEGLAATFEIYEARVKDANGDDIPNPEWKKVGEFTTDGTTGIWKIDTVFHDGSTEARSLRPYSFHDADGNERFGPPGTETYGWRYRVKETVAPEGYMLKTTVYEFGISDIPTYSGSDRLNYLNYDTITVVNKPIPQAVETVVSGEKALIGKELEDQEFIFSLKPEESAEAAWGEGYPGGFSGSITVKNDAAGRFSFPLSYTYEDYAAAAEKGLVDENGCASFWYVVGEEIPEGAENNIWNGVRYDDSRFLVRVKLFIEGNELGTEINCYTYNGN